MSDEFNDNEDVAGLGIELLMANKQQQQHQKPEPKPEIINVGADDDDEDEEDDYGDEDEDYGDDNAASSHGSIPPSIGSNNHRQNNNHKSKPFPREFTLEEIAEMKQELLFQLDRLEKKGARLSKKFSMSSTYEEIKAELERIKRDRELNASLRFQRMVLSTCVTGIEFLNNRYDPFDVKLEGWSESINDNMDDYDEIFEELHDKYKGKARMAPELKLMFMLGGSAVQFHLTNTMFKSHLPGFDQVMKQNPDLMRQFSAAAMSAAAAAAPASSKPSLFGGLGNLFNFGGGGGAKSGPSHDSASAGVEQQQQQQQQPKMKGPTNAGDLFKDFNRDEVVSTMSDSDSLAGGGGINKRKKKTDPSRRTLDL